MENNNQTLENIWANGFVNEPITPPVINQLYNKKSIHIINKHLDSLKKEIYLLIPLAIFLFLFNIWLDNDNPYMWGFICALPALIWFFVGLKQLRALNNVNFGDSCYHYLKDFKEKLNSITHFNKQLASCGAPIILFPMLVYTFLNNRTKTIGELIGAENIELEIGYIFLLLPIIAILNKIMVEYFFRKNSQNYSNIDQLINDIKELKKSVDTENS